MRVPTKQVTSQGAIQNSPTMTSGFSPNTGRGEALRELGETATSIGQGVMDLAQRIEDEKTSRAMIDLETDLSTGIFDLMNRDGNEAAGVSPGLLQRKGRSAQGAGAEFKEFMEAKREEHHAQLPNERAMQVYDKLWQSRWETTSNILSSHEGKQLRAADWSSIDETVATMDRDAVMYSGSLGDLDRRMETALGQILTIWPDSTEEFQAKKSEWRRRWKGMALKSYVDAHPEKAQGILQSVREGTHKFFKAEDLSGKGLADLEKAAADQAQAARENRAYDTAVRAGDLEAGFKVLDQAGLSGKSLQTMRNSVQSFFTQQQAIKDERENARVTAALDGIIRKFHDRSLTRQDIEKADLTPELRHQWMTAYAQGGPSDPAAVFQMEFDLITDRIGQDAKDGAGILLREGLSFNDRLRGYKLWQAQQVERKKGETDALARSNDQGMKNAATILQKLGADTKYDLDASKAATVVMHLQEMVNEGALKGEKEISGELFRLLTVRESGWRDDQYEWESVLDTKGMLNLGQDPKELMAEVPVSDKRGNAQNIIMRELEAQGRDASPYSIYLVWKRYGDEIYTWGQEHAGQ